MPKAAHYLKEAVGTAATLAEQLDARVAQLT